MGVQVQVYIGAYVEIKAPPMSVVDEQRKCLEHGAINSLYCPFCGRPTVVTQKRSTSSHTLFTMLPEYEDVFSEVHEVKKGFIVATGNDSRDKAHISVDTDVDTITELKPEARIAMVAAFNEFYADVLAVLRQRAESVEVKFGVITYWS